MVKCIYLEVIGMEAFSKETIQKLKTYVYVYSDPDTLQPFYVGKGKGNRAFAHLLAEDESEKSKYIRALKEKGKEPIIEILVHGLEEETAYKVEAAVIDLIGIENLTNQQRGYESSTYGKVEVSVLDNRYAAKEICEENFSENTILIRINKSYYNGISPQELYDVTRGYWQVNPKRAREMKYAMPVYDGMILEVYEIQGWYPAHATMMCNREISSEEKEATKERYEFVGRYASDSVRQFFKGKYVTSVFKKGGQNTIRYIIKDSIEKKG